jgi:hypothetical protein
MSATRPYKVTVVGSGGAVLVDTDLTDDQADAVRRIAERVNAAAVFNEQPRMYIERRFVGVRASGGGA